ncbi:hypothetical protein BBBOND_0313800 [Babesia bigemina]|uniref:Uncharacterized protein n=1 Tax=Babesia bigemina TaxID=5866 RepID=A0A061DAA3_BABBI|nr:hypothetical protein BBBOND_0313800 [Babesia bigemina]CDR97478.1 hypothetical protein BBBOND_0313800 [Babesia bigemina]|eukprot:XP_012769664.1 hypothetical protein BBBOND_0313800 [Babesia bigemina]
MQKGILRTRKSRMLRPTGKRKMHRSSKMMATMMATMTAAMVLGSGEKGVEASALGSPVEGCTSEGSDKRGSLTDSE